MTRGTGIAIPCAACAAALPVDLRSRSLRCGYCRSRNVIPTVQIVAAGVHLERLAALARAANEAASERDYQRRRRRFQPGAVLAFVAPLLVAWWVILGLGVAIGAMVGAFELAPGLANHRLLAPMVSLGGLLIWAGWVAVLRLFLTRRRAVIAELPEAAADARCGRCAATVPVLVGHPMQCPFCAADLLPDSAARHAAEARIEGHVDQLRAQGEAELLLTEASRAAALERLIAMTTFAQLATIGLACLASLVLIIMAIVQAVA